VRSVIDSIIVETEAGAEAVLVGDTGAAAGALSGARPWLGIRALRSPVSREFGRYFVAGCLAFACDASTLYVLTRFLRVYYLKSAIAGFGFGLVVSYLTSRFWVFERRTVTNTTVESAIFSGIAISGLGLNEAVLWIFQAKLGIGYLIAKFVSGGALFGWNFTVRKLALFR
jgi:putative flippase GtrA